MIWNSSEVEAGDTITAEQYNDLRTDVDSVLQSAVPVATVVMWAGSSENVPDNWLLCDGTAISRTTYDDLYTIQGNVFGGGDGSTTFNLPDMRNRFIVGAGDSYSVNSKGGSSSVNIAHTHTVNAHTHTIGNHSHNQGSLVALVNHQNGRTYMKSTSYSWSADYANYTGSSHANAYISTRGTDVVGSTGSAGATTTSSNGSSTGSGGSSSVENRPPYIGILYIIKVLS
jgi:microcystin-dependent protein